jgi:type II secretion system protein C
MALMLKLKWNRQGRRLAITLYIFSSTFIAAHIVNTLLADSFMPRSIDHFVATSSESASESSSKRLPSSGDLPDQSSSSSALQLARAIEHSGVFALPPPSTHIIGPNGKAVSATPPLDVAKKISLVGIASGESSGSIILEDIETKEQKLFHLHDVILDVGELAAIEKDRVLFRSGEQEEWLTSVAAKTLADFPGLPSSEPIALGAHRLDQQPLRFRNTLARRDLQEMLSDISGIFLYSQPVAYFDNGKFAGIRLEAVNFYGFFGKIGLQTGDILKSINGFEMHDQASLATVLQQLKEEHHIALNFVRNGEPHTLSYIIR